MFGRKLKGIDAIKKYMGLSNDMTLLDWHAGYDLPMKFVEGIWIAKKSELNRWYKKHQWLKEEVPEPRIVYRLSVEKGRFGLTRTILTKETRGRSF